MITADLANGYNRDVFALPGRTTDPKSEGCNFLIQSNKAILLTDAKQLIQTMGWEEKTKPNKVPPRRLFIQLSMEEKYVVDILSEKEVVHIDELNLHSGLSNSAIAAALLNLELQNLIQSLPGKLYKMIH